MEKYEQKNNSGSLFNNNRKQRESSPDKNGKARIGGKDYYIAAWAKQSKNGDTYLSLAFTSVEDSHKYKSQQDDDF